MARPILSSLFFLIIPSHPPCPFQAEGEGTTVKEVEWRESTFHEGQLVQKFLQYNEYNEFISSCSSKMLD